MARVAASGDVVMAEIRRLPRHEDVMAGTAIGGRRNMFVVLTRGRRAVVAGVATARQDGVINARRNPRQDAMTLTTISCRAEVPRGHTWRLRIVMAGFACAGDRAVIHTRSGPGKCGMAVVAGITARDMACVFTRSYASVVAPAALDGSTFEYPFYVAGFARGTHMLAAERKASTEMIEARVDFGGRKRTREPRQHAHKNQR